MSSNSNSNHDHTNIHIHIESIPANLRKASREGVFEGPTNGQCPGYIQCNLVVLRQKDASDFLLFCQKNPKACPLIEVCDVGSYHPRKSCSADASADLRTDIPKYRIYRNGQLEREVTDVIDYWPVDSVAFLIGCSFTVDAALMKAGIHLRSVHEQKNVPMYNTNIPCESVGTLKGNLVVSMKPIKALDIATEVEITSQFPHAHGSPVCIGCPHSIGIIDIYNPDFGDAVDVLDDELPVFHACGVTPQNVLLESQEVEFAITHSPGFMFVTDLPSDAPPPRP